MLDALDGACSVPSPVVLFSPPGPSFSRTFYSPARHQTVAYTTLPALAGGEVMPNARFYIRNHFGIPDLHPESGGCAWNGLVERRLSLDLVQLRAMPSTSVVVTLECAGNGRSVLEPPVPGEQWEVGAVSTAEWTGVPLTEVLDRAGRRPQRGRRCSAAQTVARSKGATDECISSAACQLSGSGGPERCWSNA
jgi:Oxidoreductase molybdopterin binding domain